jgi:predicted kinase
MKENRICRIMRGYAGSGKSYKADQIKKENENTEIVSADNYWLDDSGNYNFDVSKLSLAHKDCYDKFTRLVNSGVNVIVDNTNLKYNDIKKYIDYLVTNNNLNSYIYSVELIEVSFNSIEEAIKHRTNSPINKNIPENRMREMFKAFKQDVRGNIINDYSGKISLGELDNIKHDLPWTDDVPVLPGAILCDLDGTLAIFEYMSGLKLRSPYDASKADCDIVCKPVAEALRAFFNLGYEIIFVSGREDKFRVPTETFLKNASEEFGFTYDKLFMRSTGDFRKDTEIKSEIYNREILGKYNVLAVFDDRNCCVELWRNNGLYVFDCNYRNGEF